MKKNLTCLNSYCFLLVFCTILCFCLCCKCEAENMGAPMEKGEQEALYSAIQGFVGKWWNGSDLYPDPCGWTPIQGVSCDLFDGLWHVTELSIGPVHDNSVDCAPNVAFSPHVFALKHLKSLSFFNCFASPIHHPIKLPTDIWKLLAGSLESLEFRSNPGLVGHIPATIGHLQNLQSLVLSENGFNGELPASIGSLVNLRRLVVSGNRVLGRIPDSFGGLRNLLILDMSRNAISGNLPLALGGLSALLKLDLSNNDLEGEIPNLQNLTLLDLSSNKFSGEIKRSLQEMTSLEELVLSNNPTGGVLMSIEWQNLRRLAILDLANMSLTGGIPESIAERRSLRFLGLNDNNLSGDISIISQKLESLPSVSAIYINGNNLTGELKFSEKFYGRMGRRFGAWNNSNLCYDPMGLVSTRHAPFGVEPCQQQVTLQHEVNPLHNSNLSNGNWNHDSHSNNSKPSLGFPSCGWNGFWYTFLVEIFISVML